MGAASGGNTYGACCKTFGIEIEQATDNNSAKGHCMTRQQQPQHVQNFWTPKRVIRTLVWYNELAADLEAGMIRPGERPGSAAEWESGGIIERLAAQKVSVSSRSEQGGEK